MSKKKALAPQRIVTARGFTLLEILLAVILLGLLIAGAYSGIHAAANAMRAGEAAIDRIDRLRTAQEFLRRQIENILALSYDRDDNAGVNYVFEGDAQRMRFVASMPGYLSRGGPYVQTLELARGVNGLQLQFSDTLLNGYDAKAAKTSDVDPVVLLDRIGDGRFEYQGVDDQGQITGWSSDWRDPGVTPLMVRISLSMQPGVQTPWPTLDVPLMLTANAVRPAFRQTLVPTGHR